MAEIFAKLSYLDDPDQKFRSAHFPARPLVGDFVLTPPPHERRYQVVSVGFECDGPRADATVLLVVLRVADAQPT
jgi:hypothetical protein